MGVADSLKSIAKMSDIFGCKVVSEKSIDGKQNLSIKKRNFFEWIFDRVCRVEKMPQTRQKTVQALRQIANELIGIEKGGFMELVRNYENSSVPVNFCEVKRTLTKNLADLYPCAPKVYSRHPSIEKLIKEKQPVTREAFAEIYQRILSSNSLKNKFEVELIHENSRGEFSDENLNGLCDAMATISLQVSSSFSIKGMDEAMAERMHEVRTLHRIDNDYLADLEAANYTEKLQQKCDEKKAMKEMYLQDMRVNVRNGMHFVAMLENRKTGEVSDANLESLHEALLDFSNGTNQSIIVVRHENELVQNRWDAFKLKME
ncbi:MAG: hypothetical protein JWM30_2678 [Burkholderia sp.]|nr:hypothetical protein [Burkholderia sp.]